MPLLDHVIAWKNTPRAVGWFISTFKLRPSIGAISIRAAPPFGPMVKNLDGQLFRRKRDLHLQERTAAVETTVQRAGSSRRPALRRHEEEQGVFHLVGREPDRRHSARRPTPGQFRGNVNGGEADGRAHQVETGKGRTLDAGNSRPVEAARREISPTWCVASSSARSPRDGARTVSELFISIRPAKPCQLGISVQTASSPGSNAGSSHVVDAVEDRLHHHFGRYRLQSHHDPGGASGSTTTSRQPQVS